MEAHQYWFISSKVPQGQNVHNRRWSDSVTCGKEGITISKSRMGRHFLAYIVSSLRDFVMGECHLRRLRYRSTCGYAHFVPAGLFAADTMLFEIYF